MGKIDPNDPMNAELLADMAAPLADSRPSSDVSAEISWAVVLGQGEKLRLGDADYELAPFPMSKLPAAGALASAIPDLLLLHAISAKSAGAFDAGATAEMVNRAQATAYANIPDIDDDGNAKPAEPPAPKIADEVSRQLGTMASSLSEEEAACMVDLVTLALSRRHEGIDRKAVDDHLTVPLFLSALEMIFRLNPNFADRF